MFVVVCYALGALGFAIQAWRNGGGASGLDRLEMAARWWFGATAAWCFISASGHLFAADDVARSIGWPTGSPFQREVGFANLAFAVPSLIAVRARGTFREATIIGLAIFLWGAAGGHIHEMISEGNYAENNAGPILYADILGPVAGALIMYFLRRREHADAGTDTHLATTNDRAPRLTTAGTTEQA